MNGQEITSEIDQVTGKKRIETQWMHIKPTIRYLLSIKLRSVGRDSVFVTVPWLDYKDFGIGSDATAVFFLDDKSSITVTSTGLQGYDIGIKPFGYVFPYEYEISVEDLERLSERIVLRIRRSDGDSHHDFNIKNKNSKKFQQFITRFLEEFDKAQ